MKKATPDVAAPSRMEVCACLKSASLYEVLIVNKASVEYIHNESNCQIGHSTPLCVSSTIVKTFKNTTYIRHIRYTTYTDKMLGEDSWYAEPDNNREPWVVVIVETAGEKITKWQMAYGNSVCVTRIKHEKNENEKEALKKLLEELHECKRGTILVTYSRDILPTLRLRILQHGMEGGSFRGLWHLCVEDLLDRYFGGNVETAGANLDPNKLWRLLTRIGPLLPSRALKGEPL